MNPFPPSLPTTQVYQSDAIGPGMTTSASVDRALKIIAHIEVGAHPAGVVLHPNGLRAYVANHDGRHMWVVAH